MLDKTPLSWFLFVKKPWLKGKKPKLLKGKISYGQGFLWKFEHPYLMLKKKCTSAFPWCEFIETVKKTTTCFPAPYKHVCYVCHLSSKSPLIDTLARLMLELPFPPEEGGGMAKQGQTVVMKVFQKKTCVFLLTWCSSHYFHKYFW